MVMIDFCWSEYPKNPTAITKGELSTEEELV